MKFSNKSLKVLFSIFMVLITIDLTFRNSCALLLDWYDMYFYYDYFRTWFVMVPLELVVGIILSIFSIFVLNIFSISVESKVKELIYKSIVLSSFMIILYTIINYVIIYLVDANISHGILIIVEFLKFGLVFSLLFLLMKLKRNQLRKDKNLLTKSHSNLIGNLVFVFSIVLLILDLFLRYRHFENIYDNPNAYFYSKPLFDYPKFVFIILGVQALCLILIIVIGIVLKVIELVKHKTKSHIC